MGRENLESRVQLLLRIGVGIGIMYPSISSYFNPIAWIGYVPYFMRDLVPDYVLLKLFCILMLATGIWILSGKKIFIPSIFAALTLAFILLFNLPQFDVLFRDIPIIIMAIILAMTNMPEKKDKEEIKEKSKVQDILAETQKSEDTPPSEHNSY